LKLRFSISRLMALVLFIAVGIAAAMTGAFAFAVVALATTTLCALLTRGSSRAFFLGFTGFGWASMLLAFGAGPDIRYALPTIRPIIRIYEAINGPGPPAFKSPDEAQRWTTQLVESVNTAITVGHSLISLSFALAGGAVAWLIAHWRKKRAERKSTPGRRSARLGSRGWEAWPRCVPIRLMARCLPLLGHSRRLWP
jgi:hypothetical protein